MISLSKLQLSPVRKQVPSKAAIGFRKELVLANCPQAVEYLDLIAPIMQYLSERRLAHLMWYLGRPKDTRLND
jgi:hypothetical protein